MIIAPHPTSCARTLAALALLGAAACAPPSSPHDASSAPPLPVCQESCRSGSDCASGYQCNALNRCVADAPASAGCGSDDDCLRRQSGWTVACSASAPCSDGTCVVVGTGSFCATTPDAYTECAQLQQQELTRPGLDGAEVVVCGATGYRCQDNRCAKPCAADADCLLPQLPICNRASGACECQPLPVDSCQGNPAGGQRCLSGACTCNSDLDCAGPGFDRCDRGQCACSSAAVCAARTRIHAATSWVCAPIPQP